MAEPRTYPQGVTCWIDTEQPDLHAASRFYGGLFGWTLTDVVRPGAAASYLIGTLNGQEVGAIGVDVCRRGDVEHVRRRR